jgi:hypothetical protein
VHGESTDLSRAGRAARRRAPVHDAAVVAHDREAGSLLEGAGVPLLQRRGRALRGRVGIDEPSTAQQRRDTPQDVRRYADLVALGRGGHSVKDRCILALLAENAVEHEDMKMWKDAQG